jgi:hypothetical protein
MDRIINWYGFTDLPRCYVKPQTGTYVNMNVLGSGELKQRRVRALWGLLDNMITGSTPTL